MRTRFLVTLCLLFAIGPTFAAPLTLTLPDTGAYSYWIQSKAGTIAVLPVNVSHKENVKIAAPVAAGDRLYVLDAHTGQVAARSVSVGPEGTPTPIKLTVADFQPLNAPSVPSPAAAPVPSVVPKQAEPSGGGVGRILTGLFSLLLALGVAWVVYQLIKTRGEPLRQLAQRLGIDAPEPAPLVADEQEANIVYTPLKRTPEPIPEEAGLPAAVSARAQRGPEISLPGIAALIGLQGIAAGGTFALTSGDLTIGRDGENEIVLAENTVSRRHARLLRDGQGQFTVTDLGSANGVYVNGERVQRAILTHGDEVKVGDNYFRYQADKEQ